MKPSNSTNDTKEMSGTKNIKEALSNLSHAAKGQKEDIKGMVHEDLDYMRDVVTAIPPAVSSVASQTKKSLDAQLQDLNKNLKMLQKNIEVKTRNNPWKVIGTTALGAFVIGFLTRGSRR